MNEEPYNIKNSTNIATYLRRHHDITAKKSLNKNQIIVNEQLKQIYHEIEISDDIIKFNIEILKKHLFQIVITEILIILIIVRNLSFYFIK
jgi:hypothetical protein